MGWSNADDEASLAGLRLAYQRGVRLFDTADVYGHGRSERLLGQLVAEQPRQSMILVSKVGYHSDDTRHRFDPVNVRRQLERSLTNLGTDYLDVYMLHNENFGDQDAYLEAAVDAIHDLRQQGLIRAIGMRGPHRFALDRLHEAGGRSGDKIARFRYLFDLVQPDIIAVRDNLLTPTARSEGIMTLAAEHNVGVLINKPLGQGLLTGSYRPDVPRAFGARDHRSRKRWFTSPAAPILEGGLDQLRALVGDDPVDLIALALWACLVRDDNAAVLAGFTRPWQVDMNVTAVGRRPPPDIIAEARIAMAQVQQRLDALGEVFTDEATARS